MHPCPTQARRVQPERGAGGEQNGTAQELAGRVLFDGRVRLRNSLAQGDDAFTVGDGTSFSQPEIRIGIMPPLAVMQTRRWRWPASMPRWKPR